MSYDDQFSEPHYLDPSMDSILDVNHRKHRDRALILAFAEDMDKELKANAHKGDWIGISPIDMAYELTHHVAKVQKLLGHWGNVDYKARDWGVIGADLREHCADVANFAMMTSFLFGGLQADEPTPQRGTKLDVDLISMMLQTCAEFSEMLTIQREYMQDRKIDSRERLINKERLIRSFIQALIPALESR